MSSIKPVFFVRRHTHLISSSMHHINDLYYLFIEFTDSYHEEKDENNITFLTFKPLAYININLFILNNGRHLIELKEMSYGRNNVITHLNLNALKRVNKVFESHEDIRYILEIMKNKKEFNFLFDGWNIKKYRHFSKQLITYIYENKYPIDLFYFFIG